MRKVIHVDMDCFYAAVEERDRPHLRGKPIAVGGRPGGRGVLTTANYEARKYGVGSAMPTGLALKKCPELVLIPVNFQKYKQESEKVRKIFLEFTDTIQPLSLDEAYLDCTENTLFNGSATLTAQAIRQKIFKETGLTASAGIAPNKFLAKVASDWKKPNGQFTVAPNIIDEFVFKLPLNKIPGVGKVTFKKMQSLGLNTCGDLQQWPKEKLTSYFGKWGQRLYFLARGIDDRPVKISEVRKSLSAEVTFSKDCNNLEECIRKLPEVFKHFERRYDKAQRPPAKSIFVKLKFHDFQTTTLERSHIVESQLENYKELISEAYKRQSKPVRLIGLGVRLQLDPTEKSTEDRNQLVFNF